MATDKPDKSPTSYGCCRSFVVSRWWAILGAAILALPMNAAAQQQSAGQSASSSRQQTSWGPADSQQHIASDRSTPSTGTKRSSLNWRAPHRHIPRVSVSATVATSTTRQPGKRSMTVSYRGGQPAVQTTAGQKPGELDLPLVQPANFESPSPFDDPFEDYLSNNAKARSDPFDDQVAEDDSSAPRLIRPKNTRPISPSAGFEASQRPRNFTGSAFREVQLAQSENADADPSFDFPPLAQDTSNAESAPFGAFSAQTDTDQSPPPSAGDTTGDDLILDQETTDDATDAQGALGQGFDPMDAPIDTQDRQEVPCDRFYGPDFSDTSKSGKRNCCDEEQQCKVAVDLLRSKPISTISLDIAPPFDPKPEATNYAPEIQTERLAQSEPRTWRDRQGRVLAEGRLVNFRSSQVIVLDAEGREIPLPYYRLGDDELCFLNAWWGTPPECRLGDDAVAARNWQSTTFTWKASALCHKPLYFEEEQLERYGHSAGPIRQPVLSATHFVLNLAFAPYHMGVHPPNECMYALGYYRPGSCAPWLVQAFPLSLRGAVAQVAAVAAVAPLPY